MIGRTISRYRILSKLGEGGMGEVYLAEDTELGREVAIKVLPPLAEQSPERLERFRREARAVASLNHPNIVTLFNVEEAEGRRLLVMERVRGESLDRVIPDGGMPLAELFRYAIPMADALAAAHERGITHRDLKPANVMVTEDGQVKMLDFGLAKLATEATEVLGGGMVATEAPTQSAALTGEGTVMGTAPYMSPEQLKGREVDWRSDIFSFGILLYEMVAGRRPFQGESGIELASSILKDEPSSVVEVRGDLPRHLGRIIQHCLEKDPERRFQSAKDIRNELDVLRREVDSGQHPQSGPVAVSPGTVGGGSGPGTAFSTPSSGTSGQSVPDLSASGQMSGAAGAPGSSIEGPGGQEMRSKRSWGSIAAVAVALLAIAAGVSWWLGRTPAESPDEEEMAAAPATPASPALRSVAVLPLANLGADQGLDYLRLAVPDEIATTLSRGSGLAIRPFSNTSRLDVEGRDPLELGRELGVNSVVTGQYFKEGEQLNLTLEAIDVEGNTVLWRDNVVVGADELVSLRQAVSATVESGLMQTLDPQAELASAGTLPTNEKAYDLYLRSLPMTSDPGPNSEAMALVEQAIELDPSYAPAWGQLAQRYHHHAAYGGGGEEYIDKAEAAAERALELDPDLLEPAVRLVIMSVEHGELAQAYEAANRLIAQRPKVGRVYFVRSYVLRYAGATERAMRDCDTAMALDPNNPYFRSCGIAFSQGGRQDRARQFLSLSPGTAFSADNLAVILLREGQPQDAVEYFNQSGNTQIAEALESHLEGRPMGSDSLQQIVDFTLSLDDKEQPYWGGSILAYLGEHAAALALIREGIERGYCSYPLMITDPLLSGLAADPELADGWAEAVAAGRDCHENFLAATRGG